MINKKALNQLLWDMFIFLMKAIAIGAIAMLVAYSLCGESKAQSFENTLGWNFVNLDTYGTVESMEKIAELFPDNGTVLCRLRTDKDQSEELDMATLDKAIVFDSVCRANNVFLSVVYTANLWASPETNYMGIRYLRESDVYISYIELGNEYYSIVDFDFAQYKLLCQQNINYIRGLLPDVRFLLSAAPNPIYEGFSGRKVHSIWNDSISNYINTLSLSDNIVWHIYYNQDENVIIEQYENGLPKQNYSSSVYNEFLDTTYSAIFESCINSNKWNVVKSYCDFKFPGRDIILTEFGIENSGKFRNTWAYSALIFRDMMEHRKTFDELYVHAGISIVGVIDRNGDVTAEYYACQLVANSPVNSKNIFENNSVVEGENYFYFVNSGIINSFSFEVPEGYYVSSVEKQYISGNFIYSVGGATDWMSPTSDKTPEIAGILTDVNNYTLPEYSFGIIKAVVYKTNPPASCRRKFFWFCIKSIRRCNC